MTRRAVLITGAAAGIGRAAALRFAREGFLVGAYDVDDRGLATLATELGDSVVTGHLDVRDEEEWTEALTAFTAASGGRLDVLVNNAGILCSGRFTEIPLAAQRREVEVNVTGVLNGCYLAHPYLRATEGAHVINLASASAIYGQPELATYSATKFAVRGLTEALDLEWRADGITVTALWPLFVDTAMTTDVDIASTRSLGIRLRPEDVAEEILRAATGGHGLLGGVHRAVGRQAQAMFAASGIAPSWLVRAVNRRLAT
ncbi:SDR family oxidoreductase [Nocardioides sp. DS6]|uniref:SDR family oxidoreductase n=1 Tax=Nocardioides eburneus TaxID=3231482 RepID=A0ABV3T3Z4_9ACTN